MILSPEGGTWAMLGASHACPGPPVQMENVWGVRKESERSPCGCWRWLMASEWQIWLLGNWVLLEGDTKISDFQVRKSPSSWFLEQSFFAVLWGFHLCSPPPNFCSWLFSFLSMFSNPTRPSWASMKASSWSHLAWWSNPEPPFPDLLTCCRQKWCWFQILQQGYVFRINVYFLRASMLLENSGGTHLFIRFNILKHCIE